MALKLNFFYSMSNIFILILGSISANEEWWKFWVLHRMTKVLNNFCVYNNLGVHIKALLQYLIFCNWWILGLFRVESQLFTSFSYLSFLPLSVTAQSSTLMFLQHHFYNPGLLASRAHLPLPSDILIFTFALVFGWFVFVLFCCLTFTS